MATCRSGAPPVRIVMGVTLGLIAVFLLLAGPVRADDSSGMPGIPPGVTPGSHPLPSSGQVGGSAGGAVGGGAGGGTTTTVQPTPPIVVKSTKRCHWSRRHHRGNKTCKFYRDTTLVKKCVKKPGHHVRCRLYSTARAAIDRAAPVAKLAGTSVSSGFRQPPVGAVVRIYWNCSNPADGTTCSRCSGSMIRSGLVLTAGHCVYSNEPDGEIADKTGFVGYYNASSYFVVPGNTLVNGQATAPYGVWKVRSMWTTSQYGTDNELGADWGIIELAPNSDGKYPGDVGVGNFDATWNQPTVDQLYSIGYPTNGYFSSTTQNGLGNYQYFCKDVWSPQTDGEVSAATFGSSFYGMLVNPCGETAGASGGPVFTDVNGGWTIIGVNNRSPAPDTQGLGSYMVSFYFNDTFGALWNYVIQQVQAGA